MMRLTLRRLVEFIPIFMPALSPSMETGTVVEWKKKVGDRIAENELICTVQTDKAVVDYTNPFDAGYLARIYCANGQSTAVARTIAVMVENASDVGKAGEYEPEDAVGAPGAEGEGGHPSASSSPVPASPAGPGKTATVKRYGGSVREAVRASGPSVVRIAAGLSDDALASIVPSGKDGRYAKADFVNEPGFDYASAAARPTTTTTTTTTAGSGQPATPPASGPTAETRASDIYDFVLEAGPVLKSVDDTQLLKKLFSSMTLPKGPKNAKAQKS